MTLREILQIELWSKATSRKILVWVGALIVIVVAWWAVERYWTTPGERRAGRQALAQIDSLQKFESMSTSDFSIGDAKAREEIAAAQTDARTQRDRSIAMGLEGYLDLTEIDQQSLQAHSLFQKAQPARAAKDEDSEKLSELGAMARLNMRLILHRALD